MFVRTGLPPRIAKRLLSARETKEFIAYNALRPIDDESNFQVPIAGLHSLIYNVNRGPNGQPLTREDCMPFRQPKEGDDDIDALLISEDW